MNHQLAALILICAAALTILSVVAGATAVAANILYRSTILSREIGTRRVLGARRSQVVRMLLAENVIGIAAGVVLGGIAVLIVVGLSRPSVADVLIFSTAAVAATGICGGWLAARHASKTPFAASGLFQCPPDRRGQSLTWERSCN